MRVQHEKPKNRCYGDFILLPVGMFVNNRIMQLKRGDRMTFSDGYSGYIVEVCKLSLENSLFNNMCLLRYGVDGAKVKSIWERNVGNPDMLSDYCLVVFFK